jgi:hypothetical protein
MVMITTIGTTSDDRDDEQGDRQLAAPHLVAGNVRDGDVDPHRRPVEAELVGAVHGREHRGPDPGEGEPPADPLAGRDRRGDGAADTDEQRGEGGRPPPGVTPPVAQLLGRNRAGPPGGEEPPRPSRREVARTGGGRGAAERG